MARYRLNAPTSTPRQGRAHWFTDADYASITPTALDTDTTADILILGGGMTGLWTAYRIITAAPETSIVIAEAQVCGSGASGRNGGQIHSWYESLDRLTAVTGSVTWAQQLAAATTDAIDEIEAMQLGGELDAGLRLDGWIWTASSPAQEDSWGPTVRRCAELGVNPYRVIDQSEIAARTGSTVPYAGVVEERAGSLQPAKLCRELRRILISRGVRIFENTPVTSLVGGELVVASTSRGTIRAPQALIATNAWASGIPELAKYLYNVESQVMVTAPIPDRLDALGWTSGSAICDSQRQVLYYQRTSDGRVQFGRGSGVVIYRDRIGAAHEYNPSQTPQLVDEFHRLYPTLADVDVEQAWTGVVDCNASHLPLCGRLTDDPNIVYAVGWNGSGLAQIPAVSHILADALRNDQSQSTGNPLFDSPRRKSLPIEPFRYLGSRIVRGAIARVNAREIKAQRPNLVDSGLAKLVPELK